jgi:hypothetical protein
MMTDKERAQQLYELQKLHASEHFALQEATRDLATERRRNAGAYAGVEILLDRARVLQTRIAELKARLRKHEPVENERIDTAPLAIGDDAASILEGDRSGLSE